MDYSKNLMLASLAKPDFELIKPHIEAFTLNIGEVIFEPQGDVDYVYFPISGIVSVIVVTPDNRRIEIGIYGKDGIGGTSLLLNVRRASYLHLIQHSGEAGRVKADTMQDILRQSPTLAQNLLRYIKVFTVQIAHTALSNGTFVIEARLARWLLMCRDRLDSNVITITHEVLSMMLAVRRPGVTEAVHSLEGRGIIRASRGRVEILDRPRLEDVAGNSYGGPEREHASLIGPWPLP